MYSYKIHIPFSEVDDDLHITLPSIMTEFQDCGLFHSNAVGLGVREIKEMNYIWLLSSWQIVVDHRPSLYEEVTLATWAYGWRNFFGFRNFTMTDEKGSLAAWANTNWVFTNLTTGHPQKIPQEISDAYGTDPPLPMEIAPRKIALPEDGTQKEPIPVRRSDIDANGHVNNERYAVIAQEFLPDGFDTRQLRAEYREAAHYGDILYPTIYEGDGTLLVALDNAQGNHYAVVEFTKR